MYTGKLRPRWSIPERVGPIELVLYPAVPIPEKRNPGAKCRKSLAKRLFSSNQGSVGSVVPSGAFSLHLITVHFRVRRHSWWKELSGGNILLSLYDLWYLSVVLSRLIRWYLIRLIHRLIKKKSAMPKSQRDQGLRMSGVAMRFSNGKEPMWTLAKGSKSRKLCHVDHYLPQLYNVGVRPDVDVDMQGYAGKRAILHIWRARASERNVLQFFMKLLAPTDSASRRCNFSATCCSKWRFCGANYSTGHWRIPSTRAFSNWYIL